MKLMFVLVNEQVRYRAVQAIQNAPEGHVVTIAGFVRYTKQDTRAGVPATTAHYFARESSCRKRA